MPTKFKKSPPHESFGSVVGMLSFVSSFLKVIVNLMHQCKHNSTSVLFNWLRVYIIDQKIFESPLLHVEKKLLTQCNSI